MIKLKLAATSGHSLI